MRDRTIGLRTAAAALLVLLLGLSTAGAGELAPSELYRKCAPSVVMVTSVETVPHGLASRTIDLLTPFPILAIPRNVLRFATYPLVVLVNGPMKAGGSGVIIDDKGHFITNHHVIEHGDVFWATLDDRRLLRATLVGSDREEDYALLKLELEEGETVTPVSLGDSCLLQPGDMVAAIGSPLRLRQTLSVGVVAAVERRMQGPFQDFIQTDLTIGSGSSGGPLFNARGEVVGITSLMHSVVEQTGGITMSIPIHTVGEGLDQIKEKGSVTRGYIGACVKDVTPRLVEELELSVEPGEGACITELTHMRSPFFSPGASAGLRKGDVVMKYGELNIDRARTLARAVLNTAPGTTVEVWFYRGRTLLKADVKASRR